MNFATALYPANGMSFSLNINSSSSSSSSSAAAAAAAPTAPLYHQYDLMSTVSALAHSYFHRIQSLAVPLQSSANMAAAAATAVPSAAAASAAVPRTAAAAAASIPRRVNNKRKAENSGDNERINNLINQLTASYNELSKILVNRGQTVENLVGLICVHDSYIAKSNAEVAKQNEGLNQLNQKTAQQAAVVEVQRKDVLFTLNEMNNLKVQFESTKNVINRLIAEFNKFKQTCDEDFNTIARDLGAGYQNFKGLEEELNVLRASVSELQSERKADREQIASLKAAVQKLTTLQNPMGIISTVADVYSGATSSVPISSEAAAASESTNISSNAKEQDARGILSSAPAVETSSSVADNSGIGNLENPPHSPLQFAISPLAGPLQGAIASVPDLDDALGVSATSIPVKKGT